MMKKVQLLSGILCFVMIFVGIPFSAEEASKNVPISRDQAVFQKADPNEIQVSFSTPNQWKQQLVTKNQSLTKADLTHDSIQSVLDQSGITGLSKYQYYQLLSEEGIEDFSPDQLLVAFTDDGSTFSSAEINGLVESKEEVADLFYAVTFKEEYSREGLMALLEKVIGDSNVVMAQPNFLYGYDQYYTNMDHGDSSMHAALEMINAPLAWNYATGENVKVGMVDTGVTTSGVTVASGNEPGCTVATRNHGSAVAMVIAGHGRQNGVAPNASICCKSGCKYCKDNDSGHPESTDVDVASVSSSIFELINNNYRIINLSLNIPTSKMQYLSPFIQQITNNTNVLFIQAAGNAEPYMPPVDLDADTTYTYHNKSNYIRVAAVDRYDNLAYFSNYGDQTVHIAAPGTGLIIETSIWGWNSENLIWSGTSFAAPFVAGAAALLLEIDSTLTASEMKNILLNTADVVFPLNLKVQGGRRLNVGEAVTSLSPDYSNRCAYIDTSGVLRAKDNVNTSWVTIDSNVKSVTFDTNRIYYLKNDNKLYFRKNALTSSSIAIDTTGTVTDFAVCGSSFVMRKGTTLYTYTFNETNNTFTLRNTIAGVSRYTLSGNMLGYVLSALPKRLNVDTQIHDSDQTIYYSETFDGNITGVYSVNAGPRMHLFYGTDGYAVCDITNYDDDNYEYSYTSRLRCYDHYDYSYTLSTGIARRVVASGPRLNIYRYDETGYEVSAGQITTPDNSNITLCQVYFDRIYFVAGGNLYGVEGGSTTPVFLATVIKSVVCNRNMVGILQTDGEFYTRIGSMIPQWTLQANTNVSKIYVTP